MMSLSTPGPRCASAFLASLAGVLLLACPARAAAPEVDDKGGFFSAGALQQANQIIENIYRRTSPHKDVVIETLPALPRGVQADQLAEARFQRRTGDGLLILLVKKPHKFALTVGRNTQERFGRAEAAEMRRLMIERFKRNDYDGGLLEGLRFAERQLTRDFPVQATTRHAAPRAAAYPPQEAYPAGRPVPPQEGGGLFGSLFKILFVILLVWVGIALVRGLFGLFSGGGSSSGGYRTRYSGGYSGSSSEGGGFGRSFLGGLLGGAAGAWAYDHFFRSDDRPGYSPPPASSDTGYSAGGYSESVTPSPPSDEGQVGFTLGGSGGGDDWGSSGSGGDSGGSDFGSSGGDSGGGDWSSGGGDSGGGDSGGGDSGGGGDW